MKIFLILIFSLIPWLHPSASDAIVGEYWTEDKTGKIAIYQCEDKYCGRIIWRKEARKDTKNPEPIKRDRNVVGIQFLEGFEFNQKESIWENGRVYSIDNGNTYQGNIWLEGNGKILKMRGYIGFSILGRTATLKRVK